MGTFLAISSVIGKTQSEVVNSLTNYAKSVNGGLQQENNINSDTPNSCIIEELNGNTSIVYPDGYLEWDNSSGAISKDLNAPVFSFHIHDSDLWMYVLYNNGQVVDQFNPIPDYWGENLSDEEINSWKGNVQIIADLIPTIKTADIDRYLVRWNLDEEEPPKAYPTDEFTREDWQLVDFMTKLKLPYPIDDNGNYKLWASQLKLVPQQLKTNVEPEPKAGKPWWKFW